MTSSWCHHSKITPAHFMVIIIIIATNIPALPAPRFVAPAVVFAPRLFASFTVPFFTPTRWLRHVASNTDGIFTKTKAMPRDHLAIRQAPWPSKDLFSWRLSNFWGDISKQTICWAKFLNNNRRFEVFWANLEKDVWLSKKKEWISWGSRDLSHLLRSPFGISLRAIWRTTSSSRLPSMMISSWNPMDTTGFGWSATFKSSSKGKMYIPWKQPSTPGSLTGL